MAVKISGIKFWQVDLPLRKGRYSWSNCNCVDVFDSTVVAVETDADIIGYAEGCPLGSAYLPAYALGVRSGIAELAPKLIGPDPADLGALNRHMDAVLHGHPDVKAPLDIACWDILGKVAGMPVYKLLGGAAQDRIAHYRAISQETPEGMAARIAGSKLEGYTKFQLKVRGHADTDIARIHQTRAILAPGDILIADEDTDWPRAEAARIASAVANVDVFIEQPCPTYEECVSVRPTTGRPFVLDEVIDDVDTLMMALADDAMHIINLKIGKVGGLTKARLLWDICVTAGTPMTIEDTWGGDIVTATIAHLARSTPEEFCFSATDFNSYGTVEIAAGAPRCIDGFMTASDAPGLGITPHRDRLGKPAAVFR